MFFPRHSVERETR